MNKIGFMLKPQILPEAGGEPIKIVPCFYAKIDETATR